MPVRRDPYWDAYVNDRQARLDPEEQRQLARMREASLPEKDPEAYCRAYLPASLRATVASPATLAAVVPPGVCELPNEWPQRVAATFGRVIAGLGAWDWRPKVRAVRARSLVIHGARDNIPLESSQEWARILPDARLLVLDASGHHPFAEQPQEFVRAVDAFLRGRWPDGAVKVR
jgi:pimeloyl-ACP methyl ester carboxylesterase